MENLKNEEALGRSTTTTTTTNEMTGNVHGIIAQHMRGVRATIVAVENNNDYILRVWVCSLSYTACNANAPYCHCISLQFV
jgi:hypothetical protein